MFKCVRLKNLEISKKSQLAESINAVMLDQKSRNFTLVKNSFMIEEHFENFFNFNVLYYVMKKADIPKIVQRNIIKIRNQYYDEVLLSKQKMSVPEEKNIANYALVGFDSYSEAKLFISRVNRNSKKMSGNEFPSLAKVTAETAPDPYDIDWNHYPNKYLKQFHAWHIFMGFLLFVVSPVIDFYLEYTLSIKMARFLLSEETGVTNTITFTTVKIILSTIYTIICALGIRFYYIYKPFKTYSARVDSKFYFYNFYCLINNLVADFYGIMSAGIKNMDQ